MGWLAGGGSRGLAHLGVLRAIDDVGVPIDVVGGTSQGAFMAALFAQGLPRDQLLRRVREYATQMASPRHLLSDVTLPILSLFSGRQFDKVRSRPLGLGNGTRATPTHMCAKQMTLGRERGARAGAARDVCGGGANDRGPLAALLLRLHEPQQVAGAGAPARAALAARAGQHDHRGVRSLLALPKQPRAMAGTWIAHSVRSTGPLQMVRGRR